MKSTPLKMTALVTLLIALTACNKNNLPFEGYFFTEIESGDGPLYLYIDDEYRGELPNLKTRFSPDNDTILTNALHITLDSRRHKVEAKDASGNIAGSGTFRYRSNSMNVTGTVGGQATSAQNRTLVHKFY